jgi:hypothetical protein
MPREGLSDRLERFAQEVARGKTLTAAGVLAGWSRATAGAAAHRASKREDVAARIAELRLELDAARVEVIERVELPSREQVLAQLLDIAATAKMGGQLQAQLRAVELLGKELGMFVQRSEVKIESPLARLSPEQLLALSAALDAPVIEHEPIEEEEPQPASLEGEGEPWL